MAKTSLSDIIVAEIFEKYAMERTATKAALVAAGIVANDPVFDALAAGGGKTVELPFWQDILQDRQILSDSASLTVNKITASKDTAILNNDGNAWGANDLVGLLAGADPINAILELVSSHWARADQNYVISVLKGLFGTAGTLTATHKLAIAAEAVGGVTSATQLNGSTFVDATVKLGDCSENLTALVIHSNVEAALRKLELIDTLPDSQGKMTIRQFQGRNVIVDDGCPRRAGSTSGYVYTSYLFGAGAFARGNASLNEPVDGGFGTKAVEIGRVALDSDTNLINRRRYILHPRGVKFTSASLAGTSPTNAELATPANWQRVFEPKNVRIVAIDHN